MHQNLLLSAQPAPKDIGEAISQLSYVLERHRLIFLHFVGARRVNPLAIASRTGIHEGVFQSDISGIDRYQQEVTSDEEFLFRNRAFLDRFADEAISRFGFGEGTKVNVEGASHPYWSLDDHGVPYLQESSECILNAIRAVRDFGPPASIETTLTACLDVAFPQGASRWYSSIVTRWPYLFQLDEAIAAVKKLTVMPLGKPAVASAPVAERYYLRMHTDERAFNFDTTANGTWEADPNYLPVSEDDQYFVVLNDKDVADRLVRLFNRQYKKRFEENGETKFLLDFAVRPSTDMDDDERFLINEEVERAAKNVKGGKYDRTKELSNECLLAQAVEWYAKIAPPKPPPEEKAADAANDQATESGDQPEPDPELLRRYLPSAALCAQTIRDMARMCAIYPDAMSPADAAALHDQLVDKFEFYLKLTGLPKFDSIYQRPAFGDESIEAMMTIVFSVLLANHPLVRDLSAPEKDVSEQVKKASDACREDATDDVKTLVSRVVEVALFDCRMPSPASHASFGEPRRFMQLLELYWDRSRDIFLGEIRAHIGYRPHPLLRLLVNLNERLFRCFDALSEYEEIAKGKEVAKTLFDVLFEGEVDDLSCADEWVMQQLQIIDTSIQRLRLRFSGPAYELTHPEKIFLEFVTAQFATYRQDLAAKWSKMLRKIDNLPDKGQASLPTPRANDLQTANHNLGRPEAAESEKANQSRQNDRSNGQTPKRSWTQADLDDAIREYKSRRASNYAELVQAVKRGDAGATKAAREMFGRNEIVRSLGVKSPAMVTKSVVWIQMAEELRIPRGSDRNNQRRRIGFGIAEETLALECNDATVTNVIRNETMRLIRASMSVDAANDLISKLCNAEVTDDDARQIAELSANQLADSRSQTARRQV